MSIRTPARIPIDIQSSPLTTTSGYYGQVPQGQVEVEPVEKALPLSHYVWLLRRNLWKMTAFIALCITITYIVSARLTPIYESTAVVDVDRQAPSAIVGQDSNRNVGSNDADQFLATQVRLIQSDAVLRPVAQKFKLLEREQQIDASQPEYARKATNAPVLLKRLKVTRPPNTYLLWISTGQQTHNSPLM